MRTHGKRRASPTDIKQGPTTPIRESSANFSHRTHVASITDSPAFGYRVPVGPVRFRPSIDHRDRAIGTDGTAKIIAIDDGTARVFPTDCGNVYQVKSALDPVHNLLLGRENKDIRCNPHLARPAVAYKGLSEVST